MEKSEALWKQPWFLVEAFALLNLGFLTLDIYLAHSVNGFRRPAEYVPLYFSAIAPLILLAALALRKRSIAAWKDLGYLVGWAAIAIGLTGVILHLDSSFFYERTIRSLTYSAPFAAPLAYAGLGFLLLLNRMVDDRSKEWAQWVVFLTLGGFVGNFVFSVSDHAENGFFNPLEWVAVAASAVAVGFLVTPLLVRVRRQFLLLCAFLLFLESLVGVWGFLLHAARNLHGPSVHPLANLVYGAPPLAPLLFPNLAVLGIIGLWQLWNLEILAEQR
ncbi:MAG: hypothetical protein WAM78_14660 [Candidatus Sulfotelmatobacter sp.]|jgi:hypothetical protein